MKKGVEYTGRVVGLTFPNKGKVDCGEEGMAVVKGTVPGQTVKFVVSKKRSGNAIDVYKRQDLGNIRVKEFDERHCVMISESNLDDDDVDYYLVKYMQSHKNKVDTIGACDCYVLDTSKVSDDGNSFETKGVFFYSDTLLYNSNYSLPAGKYLSIFYKGPSPRTKLAVDKLITFAKEHHMKIVGDPIEFCHIDDYETSIDDECLTEIQLPIK